ncbi:DUF4355 domain-containing protein [Enterococcus thailandicus]|uniref:DUF4355 domain-containing protein n=1 Tax=Enterococcus thailandicus TaxID=417368 RepID=UPI00288E1CC5|nr:DUF4355 domain-containing protein [Enterococcus thailandicus]MDT2751928.1 DUF4355 domain-containing protein [Enterococcus thailandicus]MDT2776069.1 DUF4355 domain-containing protein [Enterococcus thailandicus]
MKKRLLMPMNLQFFAETEGSTQETTSTETTDTATEETKKEETGKTFSRDDVAKMIAAETKKAVTAAEEKWRAEKDEAAKLAEMDDKEKADYEKQQLEEKLAEYERKEVLSKMSEQASEMLSEKGAAPTKEMLRLIVSEDAETTSSNVKTYLASIEAEREAIKAEYEKRLGGKVPLDSNSNQTLSPGAQLAKEANERKKNTVGVNDPWKF